MGLFRKKILSPIPEEDVLKPEKKGLFSRLFSKLSEPYVLRSGAWPEESQPSPTPSLPFAKPTSTPNLPMAEPTPTPTPTPTVMNGGRNWVEPSIPENISKIIDNVFGGKSKDAKQILRWKSEQGEYGGENQGFDPSLDHENENGTIDRGLFQIWEVTFNDFMRRESDLLKQNGITNFNDMYDPELNARMAKIIYKEQGWSAWHGRPNWLALLMDKMFA